MAAIAATQIAALPSGPELLARSDTLQAEGQRTGDRRLLQRAAILADQARGDLFTVDGRPAAAPSRGAVEPVERRAIPIESRRPWRQALAFRGGDPAFVYARTTSRSPIELEVQTSTRRTVCLQTGPTGRALCSWRADKTGDFTLQVRLLKSGTDSLSVFVN